MGSVVAGGGGLALEGLSATVARSAAPNCFTVRTWQTDEGLPQNQVLAITQTRDGYLWVGTRQGLARFDGVRFVLVEDSNAPEISRRSINALCATHDGSLWIACAGGSVYRARQGGFEHFTEAKGLPGGEPRCLLESRDGTIWVGSDAGLGRFRDGRFEVYTERAGLADNSVRGLCEDKEGVLRVATRSGLSTLQPNGKFSTRSIGAGSRANSLKAVCVDASGTIWVASNEGATRFMEPGCKLYSSEEGLPDRLVTSLLSDRVGRVWVGTFSGLACIENGSVTCRPLNEAGFGDLVHAVYEDVEGTIWVGARDGLYRLRPARFSNYTTQEGLRSDNAMSICEDREGGLCVATWGGGLNVLKNGLNTVYGTTNGLTHDSVLALCEAADGALWVGMDFNGGLNRLVQGTNTIERPVGLIDAPVRVIHEDRTGAMWIGTRSGLNHVRGGAWATYTRTNGLAGDNVTVIKEDRKGTIWIGTDGGVSRWTGSGFTNLTTREGLSNNNVNALYEDDDGVLWIGTRGGGLNRFKDRRVTAYRKAQGLFTDDIFEILEDEFGHFWISSGGGIFRVARAALADLDAGRAKTLECTVYGKADGLATVQCNGVAKPAGWRARDGRLWFPTIRGVVAVDPRSPSNDLPPPVVIEEVLGDKRRLAGAGLIPGSGGAGGAGYVALKPGRGELEIRYTSLSLAAPERNRFKYRLEGADPDWVDAGVRRAAFYSNLRPGNYIFQVLASNNDGVWNHTGAMLRITVHPHFWQAWWFELTIPAALLLGLAVWIQVRVTRLRELERLRVRIAADLHDDVGARLTKVAMLTESVDRTTGKEDRNKANIRNIASTTREVIQSMDEIVWTINPKNDTLENLANYLFQYAQEYFLNTEVRCRMELPSEFPNHVLSTEQRHNLFMAVKEALNNVLKHAKATETRLELAAPAGELRIVISDNGRGIANEAGADGEGLENMRKRLEQIGGTLQVRSRWGIGTEIELRVPLR